MPLPRPQGAVAVAEVGAEVKVQQQLYSVLLFACPRPGGVAGGHHGTGTQTRATDLESLGLLTSLLPPWRAMTSPQPVGLEYEGLSLAPMDVRPRWPGGFLKASLVWVV